MLFAKKTYICEKCGGEFTKRINLNGNLCDQCWNKEYEEKESLSKAVSGYQKYRDEMYKPNPTLDEMKDIIPALIDFFNTKKALS